MKFEFSYFRHGSGLYPLIDVGVKGLKESITIKALVDSGASFSVFRSEVAEYLGIEIEKGRRIYLEGVGGRILGYIHYLDIVVGKKSAKCKVVFSKEFTVSFNLLGRDNFFSPFLITFDEKGKKVVIEENNK